MAAYEKFILYGDRQTSTGLTPEQAQALLPKVGDRMKKVPVSLKTQMEKVPPMWGQVVYVNAPHLWYTMQFQEGGCRFRESFKVPEPPKEVNDGKQKH